MKRWIPIWVIPVLIFLSIGTVWIRLLIVRTTYKISEVNQALNQMRREKESLQLRVMALRSPKRLESLALNKFGLLQPRVDQVVHLKKGDAKK